MIWDQSIISLTNLQYPKELIKKSTWLFTIRNWIYIKYNFFKMNLDIKERKINFSQKITEFRDKKEKVKK